MRKVDLRKREVKNIIKLLFDSHLNIYDIINFIRACDDISEISEYLNIDTKTAKYLKSLSDQEFIDIYKYYLRNRFKLYKKLYLSAVKN